MTGRDIKETLDALGVVPSKQLGQNFLIDPNNPHFLALRSVPMALSGASRRKQIPSSKVRGGDNAQAEETTKALDALDEALKKSAHKENFNEDNNVN
jgi:hypothetical protein